MTTATATTAREAEARPVPRGRGRLVSVPGIGVVPGRTPAPVGQLVTVPGAGVVPARAGYPRPPSRVRAGTPARGRAALPAGLVGARLVTVPGIGVVRRRGTAPGHEAWSGLVAVPGVGIVPARVPDTARTVPGPRRGAPSPSRRPVVPAARRPPAQLAPVLPAPRTPARRAAPTAEVLLPGQRTAPDGLPGTPLPAAAPAAAPARHGTEPALRRALAAECVPVALGGRLEHLDDLMRAGRGVFRHDPALGVRCGVTWLPALAPVWHAGSPAQQRRAAALVLGGGRIAFAPHGPSGVPGGELRALPAAGGHLLEGVFRPIGDRDPDALLAVARTAPGPGARAHTLLLLDRAAGLPGGAPVLDGVALPGGRTVGAPGDGVPLALRAFGAVWATVPGMLVGGGDAALRAAVSVALETPDRSGGRPGRSHHRSCLAEAFGTLLVCDSLALAAARAPHLMPGHALAVAAAARYLVPRLLRETAWDLAAVLGERFHTGGAPAVRRLLAALPASGTGAAGIAACRSVLLPLLAAAPPTGDGPAAPAALSGPHDPLRPAAARPAGPAGGDPLAARLTGAAAAAAAGASGPGPGAAGLAAGAAALAAERERLRERFAVLGRGGRAALATPRAFALADRYALVLAGAACLGVWQRHAEDPAPDGFLAGPAWAAQALRGIGRRLGLPVPPPDPAAADRVLTELLERFSTGRSLDLYGSPATPPAALRPDRLTGMPGSLW